MAFYDSDIFTPSQGIAFIIVGFVHRILLFFDIFPVLNP